MSQPQTVTITRDLAANIIEDYAAAKSTGRPNLIAQQVPNIKALIEALIPETPAAPATAPAPDNANPDQAAS